MVFWRYKMRVISVIALFLCLTQLALVEVVCAQSVTVPPTPSANEFTDSLNSVYVINKAGGNTGGNLSSYEAWATAQTGNLLHWDGQNWTAVTYPTSMTLYGIHMVNASSGWAVGGTVSEGIVLYYDGKNWTQFTNIIDPKTGNSTITTTLNSVAFDENGTVGWIVGAQGAVYSWNGSGWISTPQMNVTLRIISIPAHTSDAWVAGDNGTILNYVNGSWIQVNSTTTATIRSIFVENSSSGWAVGGDDGVGLLLSLNATGWSKWNKISFTANSANDKVNVTLNSLSMATSDYGWAVGGSGWMLQWNGSVWVGQTGKTSYSLTSVSMPQNVTSAAWVVGGSGTILGWDGSKWSSMHATDIPEIPMAMVTVLVIFALFVVAVKWRSGMGRRTKLVFH
jgi:hypothetical protein